MTEDPKVAALDALARVEAVVRGDDDAVDLLEPVTLPEAQMQCAFYTTVLADCARAGLNLGRIRAALLDQLDCLEDDE